MRDFVSSWTHGPDWKTWVAHSVLALIIATIVGAIFGWDIGAAVAVGFYFLRELDQLVYTVVAKESVRAHWFDHIMDVAAPAAVVLPSAWLVGQLI